MMEYGLFEGDRVIGGVGEARAAALMAWGGPAAQASERRAALAGSGSASDQGSAAGLRCGPMGCTGWVSSP